jgi:hypothetical protein
MDAFASTFAYGIPCMDLINVSCPDCQKIEQRNLEAYRLFRTFPNQKSHNDPQLFLLYTSGTTTFSDKT